MPKTLRERLFSRLIIDPETGCLLWTGYINPNGYGQIGIGSRTDGTKRSQTVHRVAWELEHGPIPDDLVIDHVAERGCRYKHCANVAHLEPVTSGENTRRATHPNAAKTHCPQGHPFDEVNTYWRKGGARTCRACQRAMQRRHWARKKANAA